MADQEATAKAAYDALVDEMTSTTPAISGSMFGMPCLKSGGKAFAGFMQGEAVFKLGAPEHAEALALSGAHLFDPMGGRPMKEWIVIPLAHEKVWGKLAHAAMRYVTPKR